MNCLKLNITKKTLISSLGAIYLSFFSCIGVSGKSNSSEQPFNDEWGSLLKHEAAPEWFADAKLGVYFHWGVYSVPAWGSEWYPRWMYIYDRQGWGQEIYEYHRKTYGKDFHYHDFIPQWKAPNFNAAEWVDLFQSAGAKFIGSIAEHHDGFSLWDSKVNEFNSVDMGPGIDIVSAIAEETRKRNMKFMATFHHGFNQLFYPKERATYNGLVNRHTWIYDKTEVPKDEKYRKLYSNMSKQEADDLWLAKLDEVIDNYCPDYIWMDFCTEYIPESYRRKFLCNYFNKAAQLNKDVVVNTKGTYFPTEIAVVNVERATMENITPDVWVTDFIVGGAWSYNKARRVAMNPDKSIRMVADIVSKNGVVLFSVGPMADGTIPEEQADALRKMGKWFKLYGEAIYNTRPFISYGQGPTALKRNPEDEWNIYGGVNRNLDKLCPEDIRYTYDKQRTVYAIQCGWKEGGLKHVLKVFTNNKAKALDVSVLGSDEKIKWENTKDGLVVHQPEVMPQEGQAAIVYKITIAQ